jgi:hypothetical protein
MKKILVKSQVIGLALVFLVTSSVIFNIKPSWADTQNGTLSMSNSENVAILPNGNANITMLIDISASPLAGMYRTMLAAPANASVGEAMPIPENTTNGGNVEPIRQEFYSSIYQEQQVWLGFTTQMFENSSMVPMGEQAEFNVSITAIASLQIANFTTVGSDGIWEIAVGPSNENMTAALAGDALTEVSFAKQMLNSSGTNLAYEDDKTVSISVA